MFGAPFDTGSWEGVTESYYAGAGGELIWLIISIVLCGVALVAGQVHEGVAYKNAARETNKVDHNSNS